MKNFVKHTKKGLLMATMMVTSLSFANEGTTHFKIEKEVKPVSIVLKYVKKGSELSIKNNQGIVVYKELIQKTGDYSNGFDLALLPNGNYVFELDSEVEIKTMPFTVNSNQVVFNKEQETSFFKPVTRVKGNLVYVSKLALNKEPLTIDVYFEENGVSELMLTETIENTENINRVYRLIGLDNGNYKIVFNTNGREFTEFINN